MSSDIHAAPDSTCASLGVGVPREGDMMKPIVQIHLDLDEATWLRLFGLTQMWPQRTMGHICRYALSELWHDCQGSVAPDVATLPRMPYGTRRVAVFSRVPEETARWLHLATKYGSKAAALKVALGNLLASLEQEDHA